MPIGNCHKYGKAMINHSMTRKHPEKIKIVEKGATHATSGIYIEDKIVPYESISRSFPTENSCYR